MLFFEKINSVNQQIIFPILDDNDFKIYIKREDKIHPIDLFEELQKIKIQYPKG